MIIKETNTLLSVCLFTHYEYMINETITYRGILWYVHKIHRPPDPGDQVFLDLKPTPYKPTFFSQVLNWINS